MSRNYSSLRTNTGISDSFLNAVLVDQEIFFQLCSFLVCALSDPDTKKREYRRENDGWEWFMFAKRFFPWSIKEGNSLLPST
jgi:hypothetical protein